MSEPLEEMSFEKAFDELEDTVQKLDAPAGTLGSRQSERSYEFSGLP